MKLILITITILLLPVITLAETLEGVWKIQIVPSDKEQFPWWQQIKYPVKLVVIKNGPVFDLTFTDQYNYTCSGMAMSANNGREIVFEFCGGLGTKHNHAWGPIHHAKIVNGQLHGTVTTNQHLFNWVGELAK